MTFEEWLGDKHLGSMEFELSKDAFVAGAASRDAEIAGLVAALEKYVNRQSMEDLEYAGYAAEAALAKMRKP